KKQPHELLTDAEKKANHIASEQKRRQNIRIGFDSLVEIVPTLSECQRSEALILQKSVDYIQRLLDQKNELKNRVRDLQVNLGESADGDES
ncbi:helix-loop-helix DNA-binding protein, partial [Linnemannia elongata AG-77]